MIPPFDDFGNLPHGIYRCSVEEIVERFGTGSPEREVQTEELLELIAWAKKAAVKRLIVNGSYATNKVAPNDVDVIILPGPGYPADEQSIGDENVTWPFLQVIVAADDNDFDRWALEDFGTDRNLYEKGVLEIIL